MKKRLPVKVELSVVGIQHRLSMSTRRMILARLKETKAISVNLVRERMNSHDTNAIMVLIAEKPYKDLHIGYLRRQVAQVYAPLIDENEVKILDAYLTELWPIDGEGELLVYIKALKSGLKSRILGDI